MERDNEAFAHHTVQKDVVLYSLQVSLLHRGRDDVMRRHAHHQRTKRVSQRLPCGDHGPLTTWKPAYRRLSQMSTEETAGRKRKRDCVNTQLQLVRLFVSKCPGSVEMVDGDGNIPLNVASQNDNLTLDVVDFLTKASMNMLLIDNRRRRMTDSAAFAWPMKFDSIVY